ncbi:hypothetical protein [Frondihabitans cladoniiphilus]|uniref:BetR domain-containing protein n=1 Tax=Frondihabitans cladoniiphilus TaxID=715785 RepID=A0ABP8WCZ2_9MICO
MILNVQTVASRIDAECRDQGIKTAMFARLLGVPRKRARALRTGRHGIVQLVDVIAAARVLDVDPQSWFAASYDVGSADVIAKGGAN